MSHGLCACGLTLSVKDNGKKNKVSAEFKSRPRQILLGNVLATCTILSYFFDSEQLFGEWATLKVSTFLAYFTTFKLHLHIADISTRFLWKFTRNFTRKLLAFWSVRYRMLIDSKYGCPRCDYISIMDWYPVIIFQIWYNSTYIKGSTLHASAVLFRFKD